MPDIAMCSGRDCAVRENCYRHKAKPCEWRQSYFVEPPGRDEKCQYYWRLRDEMPCAGEKTDGKTE
jgi:polyphosphate kinase 2 (PPK2 family)